MFANKDKLFLQTGDLPTLKGKIDRAVQLSNELNLVLQDLNGYQLEFEFKNMNTNSRLNTRRRKMIVMLFTTQVKSKKNRRKNKE